MSNLTINRQGPEVFQDNETGYHDSYTRNRDYRPPQTKAVDFRTYAVWSVTAIGAFVILFIVYSIWKLFYCWADQRYVMCQRLDATEPFVFLTVLLLPLVLVAINVSLKMWTRTRYENALANKANLALNRYGDNEPADFFDRLSTAQMLAYIELRYASAAHVELRNARYKQLRGVNSLSIASGSNLLETEPQSLDDVPNQIVTLTPAEWLAIADQQSHIMLAGSTGKGKTITAKALLLPRLQAGELLFVIDPHSSNWYGIAGRGGGEDWADCINAIQEVFLEYKARINLRHQHLLLTQQEMSETHFPRLNVLVDEAFLIKENLDTGSSKKQTNYWSLLAEIMSSGARKIGISLILLTQTANVEDLGISGPLRRNFCRIALDPPSIRMMILREESDHARRQMLLSGFVDLEYPATTEINGQIHLLDRMGLLPMAQTHVDAQSCLWVPPTDRSFVRYGQAANRSPDLRTNERTNRDPIAQLAALRCQGITREEARRDHGLTFTDTDWTKAGDLIADQNSAS